MYFNNVFVFSYLNKLDFSNVKILFKEDLDEFIVFLDSIDKKIEQLNAFSLSSANDSLAIGQSINEFYKEYNQIIYRLSKFFIILRTFTEQEVKYLSLLLKDDFLSINAFEYSNYLKKEREQKNLFIKKLISFEKEKDFLFFISMHDNIVFSIFQAPTEEVDEKIVESLSNNGQYKRKLFYYYLVGFRVWNKICKKKFEMEIVERLRRKRESYFKVLFKVLEMKKYDQSHVKKIYYSIYSVSTHLRREAKNLKYKNIFSTGLLPLSEIFS
ncbi:MAG: hypothetical protein QXR30_04150 [Candidatus Woesearchaeota archaeon]